MLHLIVSHISLWHHTKKIYICAVRAPPFRQLDQPRAGTVRGQKESSLRVPGRRRVARHFSLSSWISIVFHETCMDGYATYLFRLQASDHVRSWYMQVEVPDQEGRGN
jgi:hypothetical protein